MSDVRQFMSAAKDYLIQERGDVGLKLYNNALTLQGGREQVQHLKLVLNAVRTRSLDGMKKELLKPKGVVSIETFLKNDYYLGLKGQIYPKLIPHMIAINSGEYTEAVLTGAIGTAKTTLAIWTTAYQLYLLSRMASPQLTFGLDTSSEILFIFQSLNKELAKEVDYARFKALIEMSPYFKDNYPYDKSLESMLKFPNRVIVKPVSGADTAALGQNVIGGVIDELNFMAVIENSKNNRDGGSYDQAIALYNSIARRRKTRFMEKGKLPGVLCLVSSKKYPNQFTDIKSAEAMNDIQEHGSTTIYVYDKKTWDIMPDDTFTGEWFKIFIGDMTHKPLIIDDTMDIEGFDESLLMDIPLEYLNEFRQDMMNALRDIAGVSTLASIPFITNINAVDEVFQDTTLNIFTTDVCDFEYSKVGIKKTLVASSHKKYPRFVHIDLGLSSDSAGLCIGHVPSFTSINYEGTTVAMPNIVIDGLLEVKPPPNGEINFAKIRKLLYMLQKMNFPLMWVTMDSYQSVDTLQILRGKGLFTGIQSMDTSTLPYEVAKTCVMEGRVELPPCDKLQMELVRLERTIKGKIDHPPNGSLIGSTEIRLSTGKIQDIKSMAEGHSAGCTYEIISYNEAQKKFETGIALHPRVTRYANELIKVEGECGVLMELTPEHKVLTIRGWLRADELKGGDDIISLF